MLKKICNKINKIIDEIIILLPYILLLGFMLLYLITIMMSKVDFLIFPVILGLYLFFAIID